MLLRIEGSDLPGRHCIGYDNIHVAVQRKNKPKELLGLTRADAKSVTWTLECDDNFKGPYIQDRDGPFVYLSWGTVDDEGNFEMFRRAKLWLNAIDPKIVKAARESGVLVGRLGLQDGKGNPACATVPVEWSAE
jgi:hypothetical protein